MILDMNLERISTKISQQNVDNFHVSQFFFFYRYRRTMEIGLMSIVN